MPVGHAVFRVVTVGDTRVWIRSAMVARDGCVDRWHRHEHASGSENSAEAARAMTKISVPVTATLSAGHRSSHEVPPRLSRRNGTCSGRVPRIDSLRPALIIRPVQSRIVIGRAPRWFLWPRVCRDSCGRIPMVPSPRVIVVFRRSARVGLRRARLELIYDDDPSRKGMLDVPPRPTSRCCSAAEVRLVWAESVDAFVRLAREHRPEPRACWILRWRASTRSAARARFLAPFAGSAPCLIIGNSADEKRAEAAGSRRASSRVR